MLYFDHVEIKKSEVYQPLAGTKLEARKKRSLAENPEKREKTLSYILDMINRISADKFAREVARAGPDAQSIGRGGARK